jgi:tRNA (guanine37-N1)-methyltransferase
MRFDVISVVPQWVATAARCGVLDRAFASGLLELVTWNPCDFDATGRPFCDDRPYGGGAGMVMRAPPLLEAIAAARKAGPVAPVVCLTPQGEPLSAAWVAELARLPRLILVAGRYEGIDERVMEAVDMELSVGDVVLSGGEIPALLLMDAISRQIPGVLGGQETLQEESFGDGLLEYPHYTRPATLPQGEVPGVLRSGNHDAVRAWRHEQALGRTWIRRPDLLARRLLSAQERRSLAAFVADFLEQRHRACGIPGPLASGAMVDHNGGMG